MVPLPTPAVPTDNLYKFMSVFGLVLIIAGLTIPLVIAEQRVQLSIDARKETEDVLKDLLGLDFENDIKMAIDFPAAPGPSAEVLTPEQESKRKNALVEWSVRRRATEIVKLVERMVYRENGQRLALYENILRMCSAVAVVGTSISSLGFLFWYFKVQRFQDEILAKQAGSGSVNSPQKRISTSIPIRSLPRRRKR